MMRLRKTGLRQVVCARTAPFVDATGGVARMETGENFPFWGLLLPPRRRIARSPSGVRLAVTWQLIPEGSQDVREKDHLYLAGDSRAYVVTAVVAYPRHTALHLELAQ